MYSTWRVYGTGNWNWINNGTVCDPVLLVVVVEECDSLGNRSVEYGKDIVK